MHRFSRILRSVAAAFAGIAIVSAPALSQHEDHDADHHHDDGPLHFAHPIFTESPSPDTKLRFDYFHAAIGNDASDHEVRVEGEYAFTHSVSIEANIPLTSRLQNGSRTTSVGSGEIALKLASFAAAEKGILLGGGLAFGVPTGSDRKGIGSDHIVEVEPYVDLGFMRGPVELVSFASYSAAVHRSETDEKEQEVALAASLLYHLNPHFESLLEFETRRSVAGPESGSQITNGGVGIKYHVPGYDAIVVGAAVRIPLTSDKEFNNELAISFFYHF